MIGIFWLILPCLISFLILLEILKSDGEGPNVAQILKRTVLALIMLWSIDLVINSIAMISDGIADKISSRESLLEAIKQLGPKESSSSGSMFDIRENIIYIFAIAAYLVAYIGFFASVALVNFVWAILYVVAPLMIICYIPKATSGIAKNLYKGLISTALWKILWSLLGVLLLKIALNPQTVGIEEYLLTIVTNLLVGLSMLLIPFFTKSLISDGLQTMASGLATAPGLLASKSATMMAKKYGKKGIQKGYDGGHFLSKPLVNPLTSRTRVMADKMKLQQRFNKAKRSYSNLGKSKEAIKLENKQNRRKYAIRDGKRKKQQRSQHKKRR
ncbi:MAG: type IV secretion system protein [Bacteriovoracaceae bacterium]|jgi:hypothetical protein|nr:type IV secretion system protein [Bacteriovoracaceae bacterium]